MTRRRTETRRPRRSWSHRSRRRTPSAIRPVCPRASRTQSIARLPHTGKSRLADRASRRTVDRGTQPARRCLPSPATTSRRPPTGHARRVGRLGRRNAGSGFRQRRTSQPILARRHIQRSLIHGHRRDAVRSIGAAQVRPTILAFEAKHASCFVVAGVASGCIQPPIVNAHGEYENRRAEPSVIGELFFDPPLVDAEVQLASIGLAGRDASVSVQPQMKPGPRRRIVLADQIARDIVRTPAGQLTHSETENSPAPNRRAGASAASSIASRPLKRAAVRGAPAGPDSSNSTPVAMVGKASLDCARASPLNGQRPINSGSLAPACKTARQHHPAKILVR